MKFDEGSCVNDCSNFLCRKFFLDLKSLYYCVLYTHCFWKIDLSKRLMIAYVTQKTASINCPAATAFFAN